MKNVGFVNPPSEFLTDQRVFMSLGILRVATQLEKNYNVKFLDLSNSSDYKGDLDKFITNNNLDFFCITATSPQIKIVYDLCKYVKEKHNIKIILGGPHITLINSSMLKGTPDIKKICSDHIDKVLTVVDTIVIGDGEYAIFDAITKDEKIINSEDSDRLFISKNYDDVAIPNRDYLDVDSYHYFIDGKNSTNLISQMGCPFKCEFCSGRSSKTFRRIRKRSIPNIIKEIDMLYNKYGYTGFMFYDDELNLNTAHFNRLLEELIKYQKENNVSFNLRGFTRSDLLNDEQAELMYEAGFRWLLVGFESGSDKILKNMNKGCTVEDNTKCFKIARKAGLKVKALMSIGHPGESLESIEETIKWLEKVKPDETDVTIVSIYPGSNYFDKSTFIEKGLLKYVNESGDVLYIKNIDFLEESNFYKSKSDEYVSYVYTEYLSYDEIVEQRLRIENSIKKIKRI